MIIHKKIARKFPGLKQKLKQAHISESPGQYVKRTIFLSLFLALGLTIIAFMFIQEWWVILFILFLLPIAFFYFIRYADLKIEKLKKAINKEIVYAGRFLIIELESGVPLYDAFKNLSKNYETIGKIFGDIVRDVNFGTTLEDALEKALKSTPSPQMRKILWQVLNSLRTGSDVKDSLNSVIDQIVREQQIEVKEYGRKLNPMAMFYMMIAIIVPSLGTTLLVVMATFVGFALPLVVLLSIVGVVGFFQFMFFAFIKSSRPPMAID